MQSSAVTKPTNRYIAYRLMSYGYIARFKKNEKNVNLFKLWKAL